MLLMADFCGQYCSPRTPVSEPTCKTVCAGKSCKAFKGNIDGAGIILDVTSLQYGPYPDDASVTPAGCCAACKATDGCNSWVLCNNPSGCGSGCKAFTGGANAFTRTKQLGRLHQCTSDDKYPYQMCSLKTVKNIAKPPVFNNGAAEGWVSGAIKVTVPRGCPSGITAANCKMCKATKSASQCLQCAKKRVDVGLKTSCALCALLASPEQRTACINLFVKGDSLAEAGCDYPLHWATIDSPGLQKCFDKLFADCSTSKNPTTCNKCLTTAGGNQKCITCANLPDDLSRSRCIACLAKGDLTCQKCIFADWNFPDIARCINCYTKTRDPAAKDTCSACLTLSFAPGAVDKCRACVEGTGAFKSVPWYSRKVCSALAESGGVEANYKAGLKCMKRVKNSVQAEACKQCLFLRDASTPTCLAAVSKH